MKKLCELFEFLREHSMNIIDFKKKKIEIVNKRVAELYENAKICHICKEKFENKYLEDKKNREVRDHCHYTGEHRGTAHSICNSKYSAPNRILIVFHNGSNYDYHFIIKEFKKQFTCLGENDEN